MRLHPLGYLVHHIHHHKVVEAMKKVWSNPHVQRGLFLLFELSCVALTMLAVIGLIIVLPAIRNLFKPFINI